MSKKPEGIPEGIWERALAVVFEIGESEEHDTEPVARAIQAAVEAEREAIIELVDYMAEGEGTDFGLIAAIRQRGQE